MFSATFLDKQQFSIQKTNTHPTPTPSTIPNVLVDFPGMIGSLDSTSSHPLRERRAHQQMSITVSQTLTAPLRRGSDISVDIAGECRTHFCLRRVGSAIQLRAHCLVGRLSPGSIASKVAFQPFCTIPREHTPKAD